MVNIAEVLKIDRILEFSGFDNSAQGTIIAEDGLESFDDILTLGGSDIVNLSMVFSNRTVAEGEIRFGLCQTILLKATLHCAQEFSRISQTPSLVGISNAAKFCRQDQ